MAAAPGEAGGFGLHLVDRWRAGGACTRAARTSGSSSPTPAPPADRVACARRGRVRRCAGHAPAPRARPDRAAARRHAGARPGRARRHLRARRRPALARHGPPLPRARRGGRADDRAPRARSRSSSTRRSPTAATSRCSRSGCGSAAATSSSSTCALRRPRAGVGDRRPRRPLQGSALFAAIVGPRLARRRSRWRGAAAGAARPLPRLLAALDAAGRGSCAEPQRQSRIRRTRTASHAGGRSVTPAGPQAGPATPLAERVEQARPAGRARGPATGRSHEHVGQRPV